MSLSDTLSFSTNDIALSSHSPTDNRLFSAEETDCWLPLDCLMSVPQEVYNPLCFEAEPPSKGKTSKSNKQAKPVQTVPVTFIASLLIQLNHRG
ncbi:hypothetical protein BLNAU_15915 [Blattamonas nauphoetae]|uniref:Uncharacterized protein n=1 Tax=Blattamonas nauphoetae TaxID=2049346 RepID=A0ABQ9XBZ1_9EUKA|nr:hypothetical protein BLNAU_15915 [Blattamonas nauphoetae]